MTADQDLPAFEYGANLLGASTDELKLLFSFLLSYPLAGVLKRLPDNNPKLKNWFIISVAVFYLVGLFDLWAGLALIIADAAATYLIAAYVEGPYMPWIGFVVIMGHMSVSHIERQNADAPSSIDITGAQMVMAMKLTAFCWNVWDGKQDQTELNDYQRERALKELPSPLDFAAYVAFFPGLMAGPAFDYADYRRWLETSMFDLPPGTDPSKAPPTRKQRKIPRSGTPAMIKMVTGLAWILTFLVGSGYFTPDTFLTDKYKQLSLPSRIFQMYMMNVIARTKYYGVWTLTEGACIMAGIGYKGLDPKTGKPNWDRLTNIRPLGVELAQNSHAYLGNWNINTNNWLRNYMFLRVTPKGKKPGFRATLATFVTSAFWHGFYPGYYLTFVLAAFMQNTAKSEFPFCRPRDTKITNKPSQTPAASYAPSSFHPTAPNHSQPSATTTSSPGSSHNSPSASSPRLFSYSPCLIVSAPGPQSGSTPSLESAFPAPSLSRLASVGYSASSRLADSVRTCNAPRATSLCRALRWACRRILVSSSMRWWMRLWKRSGRGGAASLCPTRQR